MEYKCDKCGRYHENWPAIGFKEPFPYQTLSDEDKENIAELDDDFCVISYEDQTDRFIRVVLKQKIKGGCEDDSLHYGVWVSLSEKSFDGYSEHFLEGNSETTYFGYLCTLIPEYEDTFSIKMTVVVSKGNERPEVFPHEDQIDHPFVRDYYEGITTEEAKARLAKLM